MQSKKIPGVSKYRGRWRARMRQNGKRLNLGSYKTKTQAVWARWLKEIERRFPDAWSTSPAFRYLVAKREVDSDGSPLKEPAMDIP